MLFSYSLCYLCIGLCFISELDYLKVLWYGGAVHSSGAEMSLGSEQVVQLLQAMCGAAR